MLEHQAGRGRVDIQQLTGGEPVVQPVDAAVLQIRQRIVTGWAGELVFCEHGLFLPGIDPIRWISRGLAANPIAALHRLSSISPRGDTAGVDDLSLDVEAVDEERITLVLQVLKDRAAVLTH